jgi:hypothetical protein
VGLKLDLERYLALIHSSPPEVLGRLLADILESPDDRLEHLRVFVPEVGLVLSRLLFAQDLDGAARLSGALEAALGARELNVESPRYAGGGAGSRTGMVVAYYLGRLQSLLVLARRLPVLDIPEHVLSEVQDGGENQAVLEILATQGPMSVRSLRQALRAELPEGGLPSPEELHRRMAWLVRTGVLELESRNKRSLNYSVSPLGRRLLQEKPPWVEAVAAAYRAHRSGRSGQPGPFSAVLEGVFRSIDKEVLALTAPPLDPDEDEPPRSC